VNVELEAAEPIKVYVNEGRAVAYVHGRETWDLPQGTGQTVSDIYVRIELRRTTSFWLIERSDEVVPGERIPPTPP
jgi:hypothetical protein